MKTYLFIPKMKIHNANALSSPCTIGFPAMTAWLGGIHALERRLKAQGFTEIKLTGVGISCHRFNLHTKKGPGDRYWSVVGTSNPLRKKGASWERPAFIEEPRCDLLVSLLVETDGVNGDNQDAVREAVEKNLYQQKMASGDIQRIGPLSVETVDNADELSEKRLLRKLMPGYVLIQRQDLMEGDDSGDALDRLLSYLKLNVINVSPEAPQPVWQYSKNASGWIVPVAVGYKALSPLGRVENQRDPAVPHCFGESLVTLGEFKMPYRFESIDEIMWKYDTSHIDEGLYLCTNQKNFIE